MIKQYLFGFIAFFAIAFSTSSCMQDTCTREITYTKYTPIFISTAEIRQDAVIAVSRDLEKPGKIYFYNNYIFINELREGIHIIDNADPSAPQNLGFIEIKGNVDIAVKDNMLFADNYMDLLAIDITNPLAPVQMSRQQDVFPTLGEDTDGNVLAYYETEVVTEMTECSSNWFGGGLFREGDVFIATGSSSSGGATPASPQGVGGSMARFTIVDNYLYTVDNADLHTFDISNTSSPTEISMVQVGWNIETIFPNADKLFIGSANGMFIYSISNPSTPSFISEFSHVGACDPVFVDGDLAYVTLRSGTLCEGFNNQLDVVDISNPSQPSLLKTYEMDNPHGLSIVDNRMFLCEGDYGLKVLDIEDEMDIEELKYYKDFSTYDVIALPNDILLVIGKDGFYQYDYSDIDNLVQLSKIEVLN
ncbi:MAG: hypothetical protein ACJA1N_000256 [Saprospiraceae bacterium]|mgnify:CR=1 FL=1|jgi:hypothetical protein|tara:strand:- start:819 stop:2075 length:1257 start_codon:yes stop_codon:yes gene_type:complete